MTRWYHSLLPPRLRPRPTPPPLTPHLAHEPPSPIHLLAGMTPENAYSRSPYVYTAVTRIAEAAALVPLTIQQADPLAATGGRPTRVDHPLLALLDAPCPGYSRFDLLEHTLGWLELAGNAYWYLAGDAEGRPAAIHPLMPGRVRVVPDAALGVRGYIYEVDGLRVPFDAAEIVHFRRWHPGSDHYGLSALEAARTAILSDQAMADWNRAAFAHDHAVPAGIVNVKDYISDADFERLKREWRASYGGGQRRTAFLRGGALQWQAVGLSHTDLDFLAGRLANREEILHIFGIPPGLLSENATEANATVAERQFIERTLWPKLVRVAATITRDMLPFWADAWPGCTAAFEDIRPTDDAARLDELRSLSALPGVLTPNEIRARYFGLPPLP